MRIPSEMWFETQTGVLAICDAAVVESQLRAGSLIFRAPLGRLPLLAGEGYLILNTARGTLEPPAELGLVLVGHLEIVSSRLALIDGGDLPETAEDHPHIVLARFPHRHLVVWMEEQEVWAKPPWPAPQRILGVGSEVRPILAGPTAAEIHRLEKQLAQAMRSHGLHKHRQLEQLRREVRGLLAGKSQDPRLGLLASVLGLPAPPKPPHQADASDPQALLDQAKSAFLSAALAKGASRLHLYARAAELFELAEQVGPLPPALQKFATRASLNARAAKK